MNTEKFFRGSDGKLTFNAIGSVGVNIAVDCTATHQRVSAHFYAGDGWPAGKPVEDGPVEIWDAFKESNALN